MTSGKEKSFLCAHAGEKGDGSKAPCVKLSWVLQSPMAAVEVAKRAERSTKTRRLEEGERKVRFSDARGSALGGPRPRKIDRFEFRFAIRFREFRADGTARNPALLVIERETEMGVLP